jgi:hypothetical protein
MARPDLVAMVEAPKASSSSPTLESETTLKTVLPMQRRRPTVVAATSTHLNPAFFISWSSSSNKGTITRLN